MPHASEPDPARPMLRPVDLGIGRLFDAIADGIIVIDAHGTIVLWSRSAERMFGYDPEEIVGMNVDRLVPDDHRKQHHVGMERYRATGHGQLIDTGKPYEVPALRKGGQRFWIDLTLSPLPHSGETFVLGIVRDVTDRVELRTAAADDKRRLEDAYQSLEAFARVVSHDLKEPVRGMGALIEEIKDTQDARERAQLLEKATSSHENLSKLLEGLLDWSQAARTPLEPRPLDLRRTLEDPGCATQWEHLARERNARVHIAPMPTILATGSLVCRAFGNLVTNAIRHNPRPDPHVDIRAGDTPLAGHVEILVRDNGPGFPEHVLTQINSPRTTSVKGGFGLLIARHALERLHGKLSLENDPQGSGIARVQLPAPRANHPIGLRTPEERLREPM